jgi:TRAP-type mannitol/chloroaromatic compound transport system permease large subunit
MADQIEKAERAVSVLIRLGIAAILPLWALIMIVLGLEYRSIWWIGTGVVVGAVGLLFLAGSPLADLIMKDR